MKLLCRRSAGFTMLECLIYISVSGVLLSIIAVWLHKILLFSDALSERQQDRLNFHRLATDLRQDVQFSHQWSMPTANELILQMGDDRRVHYRLVEDPHQSVIAVWHVDQEGPISPAKPNQAAGVRRETFRFTPQCQLAFETSEFPEWLSLVATRRPFLQPHNSPDPKMKLSGGATDAKRQFNDDQANRSESQPLDAWPVAEVKRPVEMKLRLSANRWKSRLVRTVEEDSK